MIGIARVDRGASPRAVIRHALDDGPHRRPDKDGLPRGRVDSTATLQDLPSGPALKRRAKTSPLYHLVVIYFRGN